MNHSLKLRLQILLCLTIAAICIAIGLVLDYAVRQTVFSEFDHQLEQSCVSLANLIETDGFVIESEICEGVWPQFSRENNPEFYEVLNSEGVRIEASLNTGSASLALKGISSNEAMFYSGALPNGEPGRVCSVSTFPEFDEFDADDERAILDVREDSQLVSPQYVDRPVTVAIGRSTEPINSLLSRLRWLIALTSLGALTIGIALARWVTDQGVAPLRGVVAELEAVDSRNLSSRVSTERCPEEVKPVLNEINGMLTRLENSVEREKQFSTNLAHELRTPLAGLKSTIEVALSRPRDPIEYRNSLERCLSISRQTESVLENMLSLGRVESKQISVVYEEFIPDCVCKSIIELFAARTSRENKAVNYRYSGLHCMKSDEAKFRIIVRNLIDNAICYSQSNDTISIDANNDSSGFQLVVKNSIVKTGQVNTDRWFDRFFREDASRTATGVHCGIGLPLSRSLARLMRGDLYADCTDSAAILTLELPGPCKRSSMNGPVHSST